MKKLAFLIQKVQTCLLNWMSDFVGPMSAQCRSNIGPTSEDKRIDLSPIKVRLDSLSIVSRQSVLGIILLFLTLGVGNAWGQAAKGTTMWSENFSGYSADDVPSETFSASSSHTGTTVYSGSVTYSCSAGTGSCPKIFDDGGSGTTVENLLIYQKNGQFVVSGIPTGGASELTLSFTKGGSGTLSVTCSSNVSISGSTTGSTITVSSGSTFTLTFKNTNNSKNLRFDNVSVVVKTAGASCGADPTAGTASLNGAVFLIRNFPLSCAQVFSPAFYSVH